MPRATLALILAAATATTLASFALRSEATPKADVEAVKQEFDRGLAETLDEVRAACGFTPKLVVDWDKFDKDRWVAAMLEYEDVRPTEPSYAARRERASQMPMPWIACGPTLGAIAQLCGNAEWKPLVKKHVTELRCLFDGHQPRRRDQQEGEIPYLRRNFTFSGGVVTIRNAPSMSNVQDFVFDELRRALSTQPGAPAVKLQASRENGDVCTRWQDCMSGRCAGGVCSMCSAKAPCQKPDSTCDAGRCWSRAEIEQSSQWRTEHPTQPQTRSPQKPKGSARGRMCGKPSDCASGVCKMQNPTRGTCG